MDRLQKLRDWHAICAAQARYCRLLDSKDWDGLRDLMTEDYAVEVPNAPQTPDTVGRDNALAHIQATVRGATAVHQIHMPEIEIDGDRARAICAIRERLVWEDGRTLTGYGYYYQGWVRQEGGWKLASLVLEHLQMDMEPDGWRLAVVDGVETWFPDTPEHEGRGGIVFRYEPHQKDAAE